MPDTLKKVKNLFFQYGKSSYLCCKKEKINLTEIKTRVNDSRMEAKWRMMSLCQSSKDLIEC